MEKLLKIRNNLKAKKPSFVRHDSHKKKRVGPSWRKPKGRQNKVRLHKKGYVKHVSTGYGSPAAVKGLSRDGLRQCVITTKKDFNTLDPKTDGIIISSRVGDRKREELVSYATENKFKILNFDSDRFKKDLKEKLDTKSSKRKDILKRRAKKEKASKAKKDETKASEKDEKKTTKQDSESSEAVQQKSDNSGAAKQDTTQQTTPKQDSAQQEKKEYDKFLTKGDQQ
ncbi:MAG: 50S ribosomal protein L32e [Nanobdellota archaeon]